MRYLIVLCLLSLFSCATLQAQKPSQIATGKSDQTKTDSKEEVKVYYLRYAKSSAALQTLKQMGPEAQYAEDERLNALFVRATPDAHQQIAGILKAIDNAGPDGEATNIVKLEGKDVEASENIVSKFAEKSGVDVAFDKELGIVMVKGPAEEVKRVSEMVERVIEVSRNNPTKQTKADPRPYALQVLWLSNDPAEDHSNPFPPDAAIENTIKKLAALGFPNMKVKMQLLGRCDLIQGSAKCQIDGSMTSGGTRRTIDLRATLKGDNADRIDGELKIVASVTDSIIAVDQLTRLGRIMVVVEGGKEVWINMGKDEGLRVGIPFTILDQDNALDINAIPKAKLIIQELSEDGRSARGEVLFGSDSESRARYYRNPIKPGDKVYSPVWRPGRKVSFAMLGKMDINNDRADDSAQVKQLIEAAGGEIDAELPSDGPETGEITAYTNYLVIGTDVMKNPENPIASEKAKAYAQFMATAEKNGAIKITIDRLVSLLKANESTKIESPANPNRIDDYKSGNSAVGPSSVSRNRVEVAIHLQPQKYYILSASPIGGFQSAFAVQLIEDF